jgi:adenosine deaminase
VTVTLNTDDPAILGSRLEDEWQLTGQTFGWPDEVYVDLARASVLGAFCDEDRRAAMLKELDFVASKHRTAVPPHASR